MEVVPRVQEKTEIHAVKPVKKQQVLFDRLQLQPGQVIWECDIAKGQMQAATFDGGATASLTDNIKPGALMAPHQNQIKRKLVIKPGCIYCAAINQKNAKKKFVQMVKEAGIDITVL